MTAGQALSELTERLRAAGVSSARLDARLLVAAALGVEPGKVFSHPERPLSDDEGIRLAGLADRRVGREPMSHILGRREFWSLSFKVTADTLDPRPDTETLVEAVLELVPDRRKAVNLLDLGTGTGCILLALLSEFSEARGLGVDASPAALAVAVENARSLGLSHQTKFICGDWGREITGLFDVIVSNPPYIPDHEIGALEPEVAAFEPKSALAGGPDGLVCYRSLAPDVARLLKIGGIAALEVGQGQARPVGLIMQQHGLNLVGVRRDLGGVERCVLLSRVDGKSG